MWRALALGALAFAYAGAAQSQRSLTVSVADPKSLHGIIHVGSFSSSQGGRSRGAAYARINVALSGNASIGGAEVRGLQPPVLRLRDGRCFAIPFDVDASATFHIKQARTEPIDCPATLRDETVVDTPPVTRRGMRFIARAWDVDAYTDGKRTFLFQDRQKDSTPLLTTSMRLLAIGGMGTPDSGGTELRLVGYVGHQLTIADVWLDVASA